MRIILFHNPSAGAGELAGTELLSALGVTGNEVVYCSTKSETFEDMLGRPADLFAVAGGDGTVVKVIAAMPDRSIPVAILPLGTANNIANSFGIVEAAIDLGEGWRPDRARSLDIGLARGRWGCERFVEAVGIGPVATTVVEKTGNGLKGSDRLREGRMQIAELLRTAAPLEVAFAVDGQPVACETLSVEIMNVRYTGPALCLAPAADPGDGMIDVVCLPVSRRKEMLAWLECPEGPPPVTGWKGRHVEITWAGTPLRVDDRMMSAADGTETVSVDVLDVAARVLVPSPEVLALRGQAA